MFNSEDELKGILEEYYEPEFVFSEAYRIAQEGRYSYAIEKLFDMIGVRNAFSHCKCRNISETESYDETTKIYRVLIFNALICALSTFVYLKSLVTPQIGIQPKIDRDDNTYNTREKINASLEAINSRYSDNGYFRTCVNEMVSRKRRNKDAGAAPYNAYDCFLPVVRMLIHDEAIAQEEKKEPDPDSKTRGPSLHNLDGYLKNLQKRITTLIEGEFEAEYSTIVNKAYKVFYDRIVEVVSTEGLGMVYEKEEIDTLVKGFFTETVFHVQALTCCERELEEVVEHNKKRKIDGLPDFFKPSLFKLILRRTLPLVYGINDLDFSDYLEFNEWGFAEYKKFLRGTIVLTYKIALSQEGESSTFIQKCSSACNMLKECLNKECYKRLIKSSMRELMIDQKNPIRSSQRQIMAWRSIAAIKCFESYGFGCNYEEKLFYSDREREMFEWIERIGSANPSPKASNETKNALEYSLIPTFIYDSSSCEWHFWIPPSYCLADVSQEEYDKIKQEPQKRKDALEKKFTVYGTLSYIFYNESFCDEERNNESLILEFKRVYIKIICSDIKKCQYLLEHPNDIATEYLDEFQVKNKNEFHRIRFEPIT